MTSLNYSNNNVIDVSLISSKKIKASVDKFSKLLESLDSVDDKKALLWREIYHNAIFDREMAKSLYEDIFDRITDDPIHHATYGTQASKYLERMAKSNDQLIKLAELIASAEKESEQLDPDAIFDTIKQNG